MKNVKQDFDPLAVSEEIEYTINAIAVILKVPKSILYESSRD
jgi:hypothetical protein